jgi:hypothetical protein
LSPEKAKKIAQIWLSQSPKPNSLEVKEIVDVLQALGFTLKRKVEQDTGYIFEHGCLKTDSFFSFGAMYLFVNHAKNKKSTILIGSVKVILKALSLHPDLKNE